MTKTWHPQEQSLMTYEEYKKCQTRNWIWKFRVLNGDHFVWPWCVKPLIYGLIPYHTNVLPLSGDYLLSDLDVDGSVLGNPYSSVMIVTRTGWIQRQEMEGFGMRFLRNQVSFLFCLDLWSAKRELYYVIMELHNSIMKLHKSIYGTP